MTAAGYIARAVARSTSDGKKYVMLYSAALEEQLRRLHEAGRRSVAAYVDVGGSAIKIVATIARKGGRYYLYPTREAQHLFRDYYNLVGGARGKYALVLITAIEELRRQNGRRFGRGPNPHKPGAAPARFDNSV